MSAMRRVTVWMTEKQYQALADYKQRHALRSMMGSVRQMIERNETTSPEIAALAAELINHEDPRVRSVAASCLSQVQDV